MTAGGGILHNEFHEEEFARAGGVLHMIQIWVNLPRQHKRTAPAYQALTARVDPEVPLAGGGGLVRVIAGEYEDTKGPADDLHARRTCSTCGCKPGAHLRLPTPRTTTRRCSCWTGKVKANGSRAVSAAEFILFKNDGDEVVVESLTDAIVMFLSGAPIDEPLVHYGPFVMNTVDEINEAIEDFNSGKFGYLRD